MKSLFLAALLLCSFTASALGKNGALYCGKHEFHKRIYFKNYTEVYFYEDNTDLNDIKGFKCVEFTPALPFYNEVQAEYEEALKDIEPLTDASLAAGILKKYKRYYCGNPNSGGIYVAFTEKYNDSLYFYDIESKTFDSNDCINI